MGQPVIHSADSEADALRCPACDYDLLALTSDRCPECGVLIDRSALSVSQIPWTHRARIGRIRAFRKTLWLMFRHPRRIARDVAMPVSLADAKRFQNIVIWLAFVPIVAMGFWALTAQNDLPLKYHRINRVSSFQFGHPCIPEVPPSGRMLGWILQDGGFVVAVVGVWLVLKAVTGVSSYFFHPRFLSTARQNRAVALSYYPCAPLAWTPITAAFLATSIALARIHWNDQAAMDSTRLLLLVAPCAAARLAGFRVVAAARYLCWRILLTALNHVLPQWPWPTPDTVDRILRSYSRRIALCLSLYLFCHLELDLTQCRGWVADAVGRIGAIKSSIQ